MNSLHQMESFDTNINRFGGLNQCQRYFPTTSLSPLSTED
jgi:hypothetical protein